MEALRGCVPGSERLDKASLIEAAISHIQRLAAQVKTLEDRLAALELMSLSARPPSRSGQEKAASGHPG